MYRKILMMLVVATVSSCRPAENPEAQPTSAEEAASAAVGTWTWTEPGSFNTWVKFTLSPGGVCEGYEAKPVDNDWGKARPCTWKIVTDKYDDTGVRFFAIHLDVLDHRAQPGTIGYAIENLGHVSQWNLIFKSKINLRQSYEFLQFDVQKGDKFPFTK